jgi:Ca2+-binding RTX toxin-like protein
LARANITLIGDEGANILHGGNGHDKLYGGAGNDQLYGYAGRDILYGEDDDDILSGGTGDDALYGGNGNDMLVGGAGADYLDGGVGDDTVSYADETDDITVALWAIGKGGSAEGDTYKNIENIIGGKGNDHLSSNSNNSVIEGGMGADVLIGQSGFENTVSYSTSTSGVTVRLRNDGRYGRGYGGDAEGDLLDGFYNLVGSEYNDVLTLSDWYGTVKGLGGDDILQGGKSTDVLDGGKGDDLLQGGDGEDTYLFNRGDGTDTIYDSAGYYDQIEVIDRFGHHSTTETWVDPGMGRDKIIFEEGITLDDLVLYRDPGNESSVLGDDDLVIALKDSGNPDASWDELSDKIIIRNFFYYEAEPEVNIFGARTGLIGWSPDHYYGEYVNSIEGFLLDDNRDSWWADPIDKLVAAKSCGTDGNDRIEMLQYSNISVRWEGLGGNDLLVGALGDDVLLGGEGDDRLDGRGGFNYLDGGTGNDTYVITNRNKPIAVVHRDNPADLPVVRDIISDSDGIDHILFQNDIAREDIVFTLSGNGDLIIDYGLYQQHQVVITGNSVETFEMSDGSTINREQVVAALTRIADLSGKDVHEISNIDIVNNIQLKSELYNSWSDQFVEHHGHDDWNIFDGNSENEIVYGGAGVDELRGHAGNDELHGGASDDLLNGGNGSDTYVFGRNDRNDIVLDREFSSMADSYGNYQIFQDDGVYEDLNSSQGIFEVHPSEAPSNDTLLLAGDINKEDLEIFWVTQNDSLETLSDDLLIRIKPNDTSSTWYNQEVNIATIINYFNANPLQESILNPETGEYEVVARLLTESDLSGYSDKALRHLAYQVVDGVDEIRNTTSFQDVVSFLDTENDNVDFNREYRDMEDTILIEQYYNRDRTIENITLGDTGYTLTNNDIMDLMSTDNSEMIRGVDWAVNTIHAKGGNDIIVGGSQNDILYGDAGNDKLDGKAGADKMFGGMGDDIYIVDNTSDTVSEKIEEGTDTVESGVTFRLGNNIENLTLTGTDAINGTGNSLNNLLVGNSAANVLNGGAGADTMIGGLGNDSYYVDNELDVVTEQADAGTDTVRSTVSYILGDNIEKLILTGEAAISGNGNVLNNTLYGNSEANSLSGREGDDRLYGNAGDDTMLGGAGNDVLNGGIGADTMIGGLGDDSYYVDNELDVVTEEADAGTDTVRSTVSNILGDNIEKLILTGEAAISGSGNVLDNTLHGNSGANVLSGLEGDDRLYGNAGDDTLLGGVGNDVLNGGIGADTMIGGLGDDSYYVDNELDVVTEEADAGTDTVRSTVSYGLGDNIEKLILTGEAANSGNGNVLNNTLYGNSEANSLSGLEGDDRLYGNAGDDTLLGGAGNDILNGGAGADIFVFNTALDATANRDRISDFESGIDKIELDRTIFTALSNEGLLSAEYFQSSTTGVAGDENDYFLYNTSSGALLYDADGNGQGVAVQFATLTTRAELTSNDFLVSA